jgi:hypothetical protein
LDKRERLNGPALRSTAHGPPGQVSPSRACVDADRARVSVCSVHAKALPSRTTILAPTVCTDTLSRSCQGSDNASTQQSRPNPQCQGARPPSPLASPNCACHQPPVPYVVKAHMSCMPSPHLASVEENITIPHLHRHRHLMRRPPQLPHAAMSCLQPPMGQIIAL